MTSPFVQASAASPSRPVGQSLLQIVPSTACLHCDVCCRFPESTSFLRPFFTADEIQSAVKAGLSPGLFPDAGGAQIELVPNPSGEGYLCPAFDPATSECRIYAVRPLDCRLYPFALMWNAAHTEVLLGWDTKCPYMRDLRSAPIEQAAEDVAQWIEAEATVETLARYPRLIGRFQDDVIVLRPLARVTERLQQGKLRVRTQPLTIQDRPRLESALAESPGAQETPLAAASLAFHYIWRHRLTIPGPTCTGICACLPIPRTESFWSSLRLARDRSLIQWLRRFALCVSEMDSPQSREWTMSRRRPSRNCALRDMS